MQADSHRDSTHVDENQQDLSLTHTEFESERTSTRHLIFFALVVLAIVLPIRLFVAKPFVVSGTSMFPTFNTWHYLIIDQLSYRFAEPQRGDVVVFRFPQDPSRFFIKRIIGLPNEVVELDGTTVTIKNSENPEGLVLNEPYVADENKKSDRLVMQLGDDEYFVMGDNRKASADSRYWGSLESSRIIGRAFLRLYPFGDINALPGATTYEYETITSENN